MWITDLSHYHNRDYETHSYKKYCQLDIDKQVGANHGNTYAVASIHIYKSTTNSTS